MRVVPMRVVLVLGMHAWYEGAVCSAPVVQKWFAYALCGAPVVPAWYDRAWCGLPVVSGVIACWA